MSSGSICKMISQVWELTNDLKISARNVIIAQNNTIWSQKQIIAISQQHGCLQNAVSGCFIMTRWLCSWPLSNVASSIVVVIHEMQSITTKTLQTMLENRTHELLICHMKNPTKAWKLDHCQLMRVLNCSHKTCGMTLLASNKNLPWQLAGTQKPIIIQSNFNKISLFVVSLDKSCKKSSNIELVIRIHIRVATFKNMTKLNCTIGIHVFLQRTVMPQQSCQLLSNAAFNGRMVTAQTNVPVASLIVRMLFLKSGMSKKVSKKICFPLFVNTKTRRMLTRNDKCNHIFKGKQSNIMRVIHVSFVDSDDPPFWSSKMPLISVPCGSLVLLVLNCTGKKVIVGIVNGSHLSW